MFVYFRMLHTHPLPCLVVLGLSVHTLLATMTSLTSSDKWHQQEEAEQPLGVKSQNQTNPFKRTVRHVRVPSQLRHGLARLQSSPQCSVVSPTMSVSTFSPEEIEELREAFNLFDKDGGGTIDVAELRAILDQRGKRMSDMELRKLMDMVDEDRSGEIDFDEVCFFCFCLPLVVLVAASCALSVCSCFR